MATFIINTSEEDRLEVLKAIKEVEGDTIAVSKLANMTGLPHSRVRYCIEDLIEEGRLEKIPTKAFNKHYTRYCYKIKE